MMNPSPFFWTKRIIICGAIILILVIWKFSTVLIKIPRDYYEWKPSSFGLTYEDIEFKAEDGISIKGWFIPNKNSAATVVLLHGLGTNRSDMAPKAPFIYHAGYNILLFDFRGHGDSKGKFTTLGYHEVKDLLGAIKYLATRKELDNSKIGVFGISMGAAVGINAASIEHKIKAVVTDSSFADANDTIAKYASVFYHMPKYPLVPIVRWLSEIRTGCKYSDIDPVKHVDKISPGALFLIHGEIDERIPASESRKLFEKANEPKEIWIVSGAGHVGAYAIQQKEYENRVVNFFDKYLK